MDTEVHACHRLRMKSVLNARLYSNLKKGNKTEAYVTLNSHTYIIYVYTKIMPAQQAQMTRPHWHISNTLTGVA